MSERGTDGRSGCDVLGQHCVGGEEDGVAISDRPGNVIVSDVATTTRPDDGRRHDHRRRHHRRRRFARGDEAEQTVDEGGCADARSLANIHWSGYIHWCCE
jgi:hypothetical protein